MSLEYIPVPAAGNETIDEAINKWLSEIRKLAHSTRSDSNGPDLSHVEGIPVVSVTELQV